jgi:AcrR family transcriptional regulator
MSASDPEPRVTSEARRRVLDTATRLFYAEGVHAVGVDRIIAEARVAKATFYNHFPSKDELVLAYIEEQDQLGRAAVARLPGQPPREMVFAIFQRIADAAREPGYRGCPFLNAAAEYPDRASPVRKAVDDHRRWNRDLFQKLLIADGHPDPAGTAEILVVLGDGLLVSGELDDPNELAALTRDAVTRVLG